MIFITWYLFGIIGVCIVSYFDVRNENESVSVVNYLTRSLLGGIVFIFSLWVLKEEMRYSRENAAFDKS
jgi:hypothetical protein